LKVSGQLHAPVDLPPGKSPEYPLYRRLGKIGKPEIKVKKGKVLPVLN
jgi:hypothetical protein